MFYIVLAAFDKMELTYNGPSVPGVCLALTRIPVCMYLESADSKWVSLQMHTDCAQSSFPDKTRSLGRDSRGALVEKPSNANQRKGRMLTPFTHIVRYTVKHTDTAISMRLGFRACKPEFPKEDRETNCCKRTDLYSKVRTSLSRAQHWPTGANGLCQGVVLARIAP